MFFVGDVECLQQGLLAGAVALGESGRATGKPRASDSEAAVLLAKKNLAEPRREQGRNAWPREQSLICRRRSTCGRCSSVQQCQWCDMATNVSSMVQMRLKVA